MGVLRRKLLLGLGLTLIRFGFVQVADGVQRRVRGSAGLSSQLLVSFLVSDDGSRD